MDEDSAIPPPTRRNLSWAVLFLLVFVGHFVLGTFAWIIIWLITMWATMK
jgi:hypothetical protein